MRLGVLDVGSNTIHLLVVDAHPGAIPCPVHAEKTVLRLAEQVGGDGALSRAGQDTLVEAVAAGGRTARRLDVGRLVAVATSAVRDATNRTAVLDRVRAEAGVDLRVLSGAEEARLTFLAARRWFGWSAGRLLVLDIGGGSLEMAAGTDEDPDLTLSLPLGAGRLARDRLGLDPTSSAPPPAQAVEELRRYVEATLDEAVTKLARAGWDRAVATSRSFRSLARLAATTPSSTGPGTRRCLSRTALPQLIGFVRLIAPDRLSELAGVGTGRAHQTLAAAVVAEAAMRRLGVDALTICPWALREGVILRHLDQLAPAPSH